MQEARHYIRYEDGRAGCRLCPNKCLLDEGVRGVCKARKNVLGRLVSENYGRITGLHLDPVEKKPLFHFFPGQAVLSAGSFGCNFRCGWCQNRNISQAGIENFPMMKAITANSLAEKAIESGSIGLAYTYNEPLVWFEFMVDTAVRVKEAGKKNIMVSNGYILPEPLKELLEITHAFNIDLKSFSPLFYEKLCGGSLDSVKDCLLSIARSDAHLEVTFLPIPGLNDDLSLFKEMIQWMAGELGAHIPLHISRYFPWHFSQQPLTSVSLLKYMHEIACEFLHYVYLGNVAGGAEMSATRCHYCGKLLADRRVYTTTLYAVTASGHCSQCGEQVFVME